jgi:hypothetical protein
MPAMLRAVKPTPALKGPIFDLKKTGPDPTTGGVKRSAILLLTLALFASTALRAQEEVTNVVTIPLYHPAEGQTTKWGIYLTIGNGTTPGLFEFDTGGTGFYAAYATNSASPWWGSDYTLINSNNGTNAYDSGLTYRGNVVQASVTFWNGAAGNPVMTSPSNVLIGQSTNITQGTDTLWTEAGASKPPINNGAFYGDFGLALNSASNALVNIIAQLKFGNGVTPGFLINTPLEGTSGFLQIGLTSSQTNAADFSYFAMNPDPNSGGSFNNNTNISYKSEQLFNATMTLWSGPQPYVTNIGITPDTGATPALHNTTNDPSFPQELTNAGGLVPGLTFTLSATNSDGIPTTITSFITTNTGAENYASNFASVSVQNKGTNSTYTNYYYNGGLFLFNEHQVIYDLQNGTIGFGPAPAVPEPSVPWLLLSTLGVIAIRAVCVRSRS